MNTYKELDGTVHSFAVTHVCLSDKIAITTITETFGDEKYEHTMASKSVGVFCKMLKEFASIGLNYSLSLETASNAVADWDADSIFVK